MLKKKWPILFLWLMFAGACGEAITEAVAIDVPAAPSGVTCSAGNEEVTVYWNSVSGADSYRLYWDTSPGVNTGDNVVSSVASPHTQYGFVNGTRYYFVVTAENAFGESSISGEVSAVPTEPPGPEVPDNVTIQAGDARITLDWDPVSGADSYNVYWNNIGMVSVSDNAVPDASRPMVHDSLTNGTTYYYVVTSVISGVESDLSAEVGATPSTQGTGGGWTPETNLLGPGDGTSGGPASDDLSSSGQNGSDTWKGFSWPAGASGEAYVFGVRVQSIPGIGNAEDLTYAVYEDDGTGDAGLLKAWGYTLDYNWNTIGVGRHYFDLHNVVTDRTINQGKIYHIYMRSESDNDGSLYFERQGSDPIPPGGGNKWGVVKSESFSNTPPHSSEFDIEYDSNYYGWNVWSTSDVEP